MSDSELGRFVKQKWPEIFVLVIILGLGKTVWDFNRDIGTFGADIQSTKADVSRIDAALLRIEGKLDVLNNLSKDSAVLATKVDALQRDVTDIRSARASGGCAACGPSTTIYLCGDFSPKTQVAGRGNVYRWELISPQDPNRVTQLGASFKDAIPGAEIKTRLVENGKACEMEIRSTQPDALAAMLAKGIAGCITVVVMVADERPTAPKETGDGPLRPAPAPVPRPINEPTKAT
jgi:hypothetical protein